MYKQNYKGQFYTIDSEYQKFNNKQFTVLENIEEESYSKCARYIIRFEDGSIIKAFEDEMSGFIREHENDPIIIPVVWQVTGVVKLEKSSIEEAMHYFYLHSDDIPLPEDGEYLQDSFEMSAADIDDIAEHNYPFRAPMRSKLRNI